MALFIRADASASIGTGHVMRCMALGQAWRESGGDVVFMTGCTNATLLGRLALEGFDVRAPEIPEPPAPGASWLVLDGYHFDEEFRRHLKNAGWRVLAIDDTAHLKHYYADALLNQNIDANQCKYASEPAVRMLLGTRYILLRREFSRWSGWHREIPRIAQKLLVTVGGSDPHSITLRVIEAIRAASIQRLETIVVAGAEYDSLPTLTRAAEQDGIRIMTNVTDMAPLMAWADIAVSGAGSTCWELAFLGLPACLIVVADNQRALASGLQDRSCALNLGWHAELATDQIATALLSLAFDSNRRALMTEEATKLVDGEGAKRVVGILAH